MTVFPFLVGLILRVQARASPRTVLVAAMATGGMAAVTGIALDALSWDPYDDRLETVIGGSVLLLVALLAALVFISMGVLFGERLRAGK